ncbi:MAG: MvaI/BcnI family restriction endonuclease [archaeon]
MSNLPKVDIVEELKELFKQGFIKSLRSSDTGIGYTLETLLKIKENNSGEPDFNYNGVDVELKSQRESAKSKITLMTKVPNWEPLEPKIILEKFGYKDIQGRQGLKITLNAHTFNAQGFKLEVDRKANKLNILQREYGVVAYFDIKELMQKLSEKIYKNLILVLAENKREKGEEYFKFKKAILLKDLNEESFERLFDDGTIVWEFRMQIQPWGAVRDHGPGFRIARNRIKELYAKEEIIFDGSKLSEEQK